MHIVRLVSLLAAAVVCAGVAERAVALEPAAVFAKVSPSVWEVRVAGSDGRPLSIGSAVVIADGVAITNCHVLRGGKQVWLKRGNASYGARLQYPDVERDLCQLRVADFHAPAVTLAPGSALVTGEKVYAVGNPLGLELTISEGLTSSLRTDDEGRLRSIQTSAPISQGSSGGGLFDADGRLIGITDHQVVLTMGQNLNFAIPADWIADVPARGQKSLAQATAAPAAYASSAQAAPPLRRTRAKPTGRLRYVSEENVAEDFCRLRRRSLLLGRRPERRISGDGFLYRAMGQLPRLRPRRHHRRGQVTTVATPECY
jgi:serine protease Do